MRRPRSYSKGGAEDGRRAEPMRAQWGQVSGAQRGKAGAKRSATSPVPGCPCVSVGSARCGALLPRFQLLCGRARLWLRQRLQERNHCERFFFFFLRF